MYIMYSAVSNAFLALLFHFVLPLEHFSEWLSRMHRLSFDCFIRCVAMEYAYICMLYITQLCIYGTTLYIFSVSVPHLKGAG